ncbi:Uncharacterized membrane protein YccC [Arboricoccus pini]|uniref:Uncharacterized membrane protein YccC n=1 Tax=Arboricoccus pini TaxID=1963835 RepID=A0A212PZP7_9PROT|nr:FUSC family protein [Arboricoccus pini]SNB52418.1 Uncharacterized membrane protein YccC [Arboricoccus pini]
MKSAPDDPARGSVRGTTRATDKTGAPLALHDRPPSLPVYLFGHLRRRLQDVLQAEDPGGERMTLGLRVLTAFVLAGLGGSFVAARTGQGNAMVIPPVAALFAAFACMLEAGQSRFGACRDILIMILAGTGSAIVAALMRPLLQPIGAQGLLLVVAAFMGLWIRRFGPTGHGAGVLLFLGAVYGLPFAFGPDHARWLLLAGIIAMAAAMTLRLQAGTSQADLLVLARASVFRRVAVRLMRDCRAALHDVNGDALARAARRRDALRTAWSDLRELVENGIAPDHPNRPRLQTTIYRLYVLNQATTTAAEALSGLAADLGHLDTPARANVSRMLLRLQRLASEADPPPASIEATEESITSLRALAIKTPHLPATLRLDLLRLVFAATRMVRGIRSPLDLGGATMSKPQGGQASRLLPTTRVAIQGSAAALLIVLVDSILHQSHSYWAIVTAALVMTTTLGDTWRRAVQRGVGTAIGVMIGLALGPLTDYAQIVMLPVLMIAVGVFAMNVKSRYDVACGAVGLAVVLGLEVFQQAPLAVLFSRIWETGFGSLVGILVAATVLPVRLADQVRSLATDVIGHAAETTRRAFQRLEIAETASDRYERTGPALLALWGAERLRFRNLADEFRMRRRETKGGPLLLAALDSLVEQVVLLDDNATMLDAALPESLVGIVRTLDERTERAFAALAARLAGGPGPAVPAIDDLLPMLAEALPFAEASTPQAQGNLVIQAQILYHARKILQLIGEIVHDIDHGALTPA